MEPRGSSADHPILAGMPETRYLKCFIVQVVSHVPVSSMS
jgi:23S rRNA (cytosine1962-C5)-methyltransferase